MEILIFNSYDQKLDVTKIFPDHLDNIHIFSAHPLLGQDQVKYFEQIPVMDTAPFAEYRVLQHFQQAPFQYLLAHDEYDMIKMGRLRDRLGLPGQTEESGTAFRNKIVMKDYLSKQVKVPPYQRLHSFINLLDFIDKYQYPVIIKPIDQGASRGTHVLHGPEDLLEFSKLTWLDNLEVEKYIQGDMYVVDAVVEEGIPLVLSVSKYYQGCLAFKEQKSSGVTQLHPTDSLYQRLASFLQDVLSALPTPPVAAYHLEVFLTPENELVVCEITSRVGGGMIPQITKLTYGVDMLTTWFRRSCQLPLFEKPMTNPEKIHGFLFIPPLEGKLVSFPQSLPFDWVLQYDLFCEKGQIFQRASRSIDRIAAVIFEGENDEELKERIQLIDEWYRSQWVWK